MSISVYRIASKQYVDAQIGGVQFTMTGLQTQINTLNNNKMDKVTGATFENLPEFGAGGTLKDSGVKKEDFEQVIRKIASFQVTPDDHHYPTEKLVKDNIDSISVDISDLQTIVGAINAGPAGIYNDIYELIADDPDKGYIYLTLDNGHWNYWDGTDWVSGGIYQDTTAFNDLAGAGRTTENVFQNAQDILSIITAMLEKVNKPPVAVEGNLAKFNNERDVIDSGVTVGYFDDQIDENRNDIIRTIRTQQKLLTKDMVLTPARVNYSMLEAVVGAGVTVTVEEDAEWVIFD